jgi:dipeptidyl-peptidase 4
MELRRKMKYQNKMFLALARVKSAVFGLAVFAMAGPLATTAVAQAVPPALTPERAFASPDLSGPKLLGAKLSPDGQLVTWLQAKADNSGVQDLWAAPVKGGVPFVLVDANAFSSATATLTEAEKSRRERMRVSGRGVVDYAWEASAKGLLVPLNGDIYYVDRATSKVKRLTDTPQDEVDAKLSSDGRWLAYARTGNADAKTNGLFVRDIVTGAETVVAQAGANEANVTYGVAEFIAQEELDRYTGYWWSPDATRIAYARVDESGVDVVTRLEFTGDEIKPVAQRYPRAGRPNAKVTLFIKALKGDKPVAVDFAQAVGTDDYYLARVDWAPNGKAAFVQVLTRDQQKLVLLRVDPVTGRTDTVLEERSDTWVYLHDDFHPLTDGRFLWTSERDGNRHIYLYGANGKVLRQVTRGDWPVDRINAVDEVTGQVWFEASKDTPIEHRLYRTRFDRTTDPIALTSAGGWWTAQVAPGGSAFIGSYSDPATPPNSALYDGEGRRLRWLQANTLNASHPYAPYKDLYPQPEFGTLKAADGQTLYHLMLKPRGFDPAKKYPVVVMVYGGPARALVQKTWVAPNLRLYQEAGFIVFILDNRGTPGRSYAFGRSIYKRFGGPDIDDQIAGGNWLKTLSYVDGAHIGIFGWSQGGLHLSPQALPVRHRRNGGFMTRPIPNAICLHLRPIKTAMRRRMC